MGGGGGGGGGEGEEDLSGKLVHTPLCMKAWTCYLDVISYSCSEQLYKIYLLHINPLTKEVIYSLKKISSNN